MNNTVMNYAQKKANAQEVFLVGRGNNIAFYSVNKSNVKDVKIRKFDIGEQPLQPMVNWYASQLINEAIKTNCGLVLHTVGSVAITYRSVLKAMKDFMSQEDTIDTILSSSYYTESEKDDEGMKVVKEKSRKATTLFVKAIFAIKEAGLFLEVQDISDYNKIALNVPEGLTLEEGEKLNFVDGEDAEGFGITVQGWSNFKRDNAILHIRQDNEGSNSYYLNREENLKGSTYTKVKAIQSLWEACPEVLVEPEVVIEDINISNIDF